MYEWLMGVKYNICHSMVYFLLYLNSENFMKLLNYYDDVVGDCICLCAYMLLVNFLTCYWCWFNGVSMYWNMLVLIVEVVWIYALLSLSHRSTHCWCRISYPCWWRILCIQLFGVIMMCLLHHGVTTSEVIWYHTCLESV